MSDFPGSLSQGMQPSLYPFCSATRLTNFIRHEKLERKEPLSLLWLILSVRSRCLGIKKNVARDRQGKHRKRHSHNHAKFTLSLSLAHSLPPTVLWQRRTVLPECVRLRPGESAWREGRLQESEAQCSLPLQRERERESLPWSHCSKNHVIIPRHLTLRLRVTNRWAQEP